MFPHELLPSEKQSFAHAAIASIDFYRTRRSKKDHHIIASHRRFISLLHVSREKSSEEECRTTGHSTQASNVKINVAHPTASFTSPEKTREKKAQTQDAKDRCIAKRIFSQTLPPPPPPPCWLSALSFRTRHSLTKHSVSP